MKPKSTEIAGRWRNIISQCWADEAFKRRFIADPPAVMKEAGFDVPADIEFKVVENTDKINYIVLPADSSQLSDDQLDNVAGGIPGHWA
jgi:hypothetical protein